MVLYHYSSYKNGNTIVNEKELKINQKSRMTGKFATTSGYLYFTTIDRAIYMGFASNNDNNNNFYVFRADIPEKDLMVDYDEYEIWKKVPPENSIDFSKSLKEVHSVRVGHNIGKDYDLSCLLLPHILSTNESNEDKIFIKGHNNYHSGETAVIQEYEEYFKSRWVRI